MRLPQITLVLPRPATWIEKNAETRLEATAVDPEDGPIPPERVRWTGLALARPVTGAVLPLEILREEEQRIVVEAADRWNECARETLAIRPFRYLPAETPAARADNAAAAIRAMDSGGLAAMLADSFLYVPCTDEAASAGWPFTWSRSEFVEMAERGSWRRFPTAQVGFEGRRHCTDRGGPPRKNAPDGVRGVDPFRDNRGSPGAAA